MTSETTRRLLSIVACICAGFESITSRMQAKYVTALATGSIFCIQVSIIYHLHVR
jgi:hypothetical protein